jgi:ABC-type Fe3+ transport system permease subunit
VLVRTLFQRLGTWLAVTGFGFMAAWAIEATAADGRIFRWPFWVCVGMVVLGGLVLATDWLIQRRPIKPGVWWM